MEGMPLGAKAEAAVTKFKFPRALAVVHQRTGEHSGCSQAERVPLFRPGDHILVAIEEATDQFSIVGGNLLKAAPLRMDVEVVG